tara:strand:- start:77 stop:289 length:213 start_codon:yes stop_codon:yes gene_type:complete
MNETELKNLILTYQKKVNDFLSQAIAFEARTLSLSQEVEVLKQQLVEKEQQLAKLSKPKRTTKNIDSEEF